MAVTILLPNALRPFAAFNDRVALDATTVAEALKKLVERYPQLTAHVPADPAAMPVGGGVYRGGMDIRKLQGGETPLQRDDILTLIVPSGDL